MMNPDQLFENITSKLERFHELFTHNEIDIITPLKVGSQATQKEFNEVSKHFKFSLPDQLRTLYTTFAMEIEFDYQFDNDFEEPFDGIFSGGLNWSLDRFPEMYANYIGWTESWLDPLMEFEDEEFKRQEQIVLNKIPLAEVPNGDLIVMDIDSSRVTYLSHECDEMHGKTLGTDLFDYLDFLQSIWFVGNEDWQFEAFYNSEIDCMEKNGATAQKWRSIVENGS